jgi:hypothetical protein
MPEGATMKRLLPLALILLTGCSHLPVTPGAAKLPTASRMLARGEGVPLSIVKIQNMAGQGLTNSSVQSTWDLKFRASNYALQQIDIVQLETAGLNNVATKLGLMAVNGYGYVGFHPTDENKYKLQVVVLQFLKDNQTENSLALGGRLFSMGAAMIESTTAYDQGCRVGISVLTVLRDYYKNKEMSKKAGDLLKKALASPDKPTVYHTMLEGLKDLSEVADKPQL